MIPLLIVLEIKILLIYVPLAAAGFSLGSEMCIRDSMYL